MRLYLYVEGRNFDNQTVMTCLSKWDVSTVIEEELEALISSSRIC